MAYSNEKILHSLGTVEDPDFKKDLVSLKMIEDLEVNGKEISFTIVLTTPACPLKEKLKNDCIEAIHRDIDPEAMVIVNFTSRVTSLRDAQVNILPNVKNIICVTSGKGGVGKSTVSVNLAFALAKQGAGVGLIDADIHGPSIPTMLSLQGQKPQVREIKGKHYILPIEKDGVKVLSIGFLVDERQAVVWRGPMVTAALKQFITDVTWGKLDYLIIDMPPGTGDVHITMAQTVPLTGAVIVTTPQDVALADARKAIGMFQLPDIKVPIIGIVENMSYFSPPELPHNKYYIFGKGGGRKVANEYEVPFLGEVPILEAIRQGGDSGKPIVVQSTAGNLGEAFMNLAQTTAQQIAIKNAMKIKEEALSNEQ
jgi:ATP-binding protein involved in chromosome partitioning